MRAKMYFILFVVVLQSILVSCTDYFVILSCNDPVIQGAEVTFTAKLLTNDGPPDGEYEYVWKDDGIPTHTRDVTKKSEDSWNVSFPASDYPPGPYKMQVIVLKCHMWNTICIPVTSKRIQFNITSKLNGHLKLIQDHHPITTQYVATKIPITHEISLSTPDDSFLKKNATSIVTYWFVDCVYYGSSPNFTFNFTYNKTDSEHVVEALVVAGFEPLTTPAPPTTTTTTIKPNTTTVATTTTKATTIKPVTTTKAVNLTMPPLFHHPSFSRRRREANNTIVKENLVDIPSTTVSFPYVCMNHSEIAPDLKKVYGYFSKKIIVKDPINNITLVGNNWLKQGDEVRLQAKCNGSPPFHYCIDYYYNATTNDTCTPEFPLDSCEFGIEHYYNEPIEHNILIIIRNLVTTYKSPLTVNIYKVEKRSQLSVIVVPVSFSLVAVVLIVFGIAYYIQNRRRFTVEVANFDFGQQYTDLEYKTFRERLRDSVSNSFTKTPKTSETPEPSIWPPSRKYGSMT